MKQNIIVFFLLFLYFKSNSQPHSFRINEENYLNFIKSHQDYNLLDANDKLIHFQFYPNKDSKLNYLSTLNELFALPNGTGAVYKLNKTKSNTFERILYLISWIQQLCN